MSHERDGINFSLLSLKSFKDERLARSSLDLLLNGLSFVKLTKFGAFAPLNGKVPNGDLQPLVDAWFCQQDLVSPFSTAGERVLCLEGARGRVNMMITWSDNPFPLNSISASFPSQYLAEEASCESFLAWIENLTASVDPVFGFVQNMMTKGWATPYDLTLRLPEIPWGTILGKPYIEMFGEDKIRTAPYASVEKWSSGHLFCKLTDDLLNPQLPIELRQAVREHLGEDAFMQGSRQPRHYKVGRSPLSLDQ